MSGLVINGVPLWQLLLYGLLIGLAAVTAVGLMDLVVRRRFGPARSTGTPVLTWVGTAGLLDGRVGSARRPAADLAEPPEAPRTDHAALDDGGLFPGTTP